MNHQFNSSYLSLGLELELQLTSLQNQNLSPRARNIIKSVRGSEFKDNIKPEITQSMIEVNSSIHLHPANLHQEMNSLCLYLNKISKQEKVMLCGGGTHPFQKWTERKIFPLSRFRELYKKYGYLAKRYTVFSMHVHLGCDSPDKAIYLTHALSRYVPQLIALSASSPFYSGTNTGFNSSRLNIGSAFPLSGHIPFVKDWSEFCAYYTKLHELEIIESMKDFYWDVRPKPEYGTVEIRVCDMPLTLSKATLLVAYMQIIAYYILETSPYELHQEMYDLYDYNRFQACRLGYDGIFINPFTLERTTIQKDILATIKTLRPYAKKLGTHSYLYTLKKLATHKENDANFLKNQFSTSESFAKTVREACQAWHASLVNDVE